MWKSGKNVKQIAEELGVTVSIANNDVRVLLKDGKIEPRKKELPKGLSSRKKIVDLYDSGKDIKEITNELGLTIPTIKKDINYLKVKGLIEIDPDREPKVLKNKGLNESPKRKRSKMNEGVVRRKYFSMMIEHILDLYKKGEIDKAIEYLESLANETNLQGEAKEKFQEIMDMLQSKINSSEKHIVIEEQKGYEKIFLERVENLYYAGLSSREIASLLRTPIQEVEDKISELISKGIIQKEREDEGR